MLSENFEIINSILDDLNENVILLQHMDQNHI